MKPRTLVLSTVLLLVAALATAAHAQNFSVLYTFGSQSGDPANPSFSGIVAQGRDGNLYSTTDSGGANDAGAIFKIEVVVDRTATMKPIVLTGRPGTGLFDQPQSTAGGVAPKKGYPPPPIADETGIGGSHWRKQ